MVRGCTFGGFLRQNERDQTELARRDTALIYGHLICSYQNICTRNANMYPTLCKLFLGLLLLLLLQMMLKMSASAAAGRLALEDDEIHSVTGLHKTGPFVLPLK